MMKRRIVLAAALAYLLPTAAQAVTYVAICNDGQHVQYNHTVGGPGLLYFSNSTTNGLQIARLDEVTASKSSVCGAVTGNSPAALSPPLSQLCIDLVKNTIYMLWHDPIHPALPVKNMGLFCKATVTVH
jgi:hypothetical protein